MPRIYKQKRNGRRRCTYDPDVLCNAIRDVKEHGLSIRQSAKKNGVDKSKLSRAIRRVQARPSGGQTSLSPEMENVLVNKFVTCSTWGYPLDTLDIRLFVKWHLDSSGLTVNRFNGNMPGPDWAESFLKRHAHRLSNRFTSNIKRARAEISARVIHEYFDNIEDTLKDIPAGNIFNYDETNFSDSLGKKKCVVKRGCKYPDRVMNSSKTSFSVMFCGSAAGRLLPLYVVYKATNIWQSWCEGGPSGCRFNRTSSGWIDKVTFEDWFCSIFLREVRNVPGVKVLIGDNLSAHLSVRVLDLCQRHNIRFVFLPSCATHLLQPLDVSYFAPLKRVWRRILTNWKNGAGRNLPTIPKDHLPNLISLVLAELHEESRGNHNLIAGFRKCGLQPIDREVVLRSLPPEARERDSIETAIGDSLVEFLRNMRFRPDRTTRRRRRKLNVPPGRSVSIDDLESSQESLSIAGIVSNDSSSGSDFSSSDSESTIESESNSEHIGDRNSEQDEMDCSDSRPDQFAGVTKLDFSQYRIGDYILVKVETVDGLRAKHFISRVEEFDIENDEVEVTFLRKYRDEKQCFVLTQQPMGKPELAAVGKENIVGKIDEPIILRRGVLKFCHIDSDEWK